MANRGSDEAGHRTWLPPLDVGTGLTENPMAGYPMAGYPLDWQPLGAHATKTK
jgi:hypothetical protein